MNTSLSWMKMYVPDLDVTAREYTDAIRHCEYKVETSPGFSADLERL